MSPDAAVALDPELAVAAAVLRDPALPGRPWSERQIAAMLPLLAEGSSAPEVEASACGG